MVAVRAVIPSLLLAAAAEALLAMTWFTLRQEGGGRGLVMALWIWPATWMVCATIGLAVRPRQRAIPAPALGGDGRMAIDLIRTLASQTLLTLTPAIVVFYAAAALFMAWRAWQQA